MKSFYKKLVILVLALQITSCASYVQKTQQMRKDLSSNNFSAALIKLDKLASDLGASLTNLHRGLLLRAMANYTASNSALETAKKEIAATLAISITEQATSLATNDEQVSFTGAWFEQLLIYFYKALNYIDLKELDSARVEMLQAQVIIKGWDKKEHNWYVINYLSGIIYEMLGETDSAIISYRHAIKNAGPLSIRDLQVAFLRLLAKDKRNDELQKYLKQFSIARDSINRDEQTGELIVFVGSNIISNKESQQISYFAPTLEQHLMLALPSYLSKPFVPSSPYLNIGINKYGLNYLVNLDAIARQSLQTNMPRITAKTALRAVTKHKMLSEAGDNPLSKVGMKIFNMASEIADTRAWDSLPHSLFSQRVSLAAGEYTLQICTSSKPAKCIKKNVTISSNKISLLSIDRLS